jgi:hypothetical protein
MLNREKSTVQAEITCTVPTQAKSDQNIAYFSKRYNPHIISPG